MDSSDEEGPQEPNLAGLQQSHHKRAASEDPDQSNSQGSQGLSTVGRRPRPSHARHDHQLETSPAVSTLHAQSQQGIKHLSIEQIAQLTSTPEPHSPTTMDVPEQAPLPEPMLATGPGSHAHSPAEYGPEPEPMLVAEATDPDHQPTDINPQQPEPHFMLDPPDGEDRLDGVDRPTPIFTIYPPSFSDTDSQLLSESPASNKGWGPAAAAPGSLTGSEGAMHQGGVSVAPLQLPLPHTSRSLSEYSIGSLPDSTTGNGVGGVPSQPESPAQQAVEAAQQGSTPFGSQGATWQQQGQSTGQQQSPFSPPGAWSAWWTANRGHPAAAYGGNLGAWLHGGRPHFGQTEAAGGQEQAPLYPPGPGSNDGSCVSDLATNHLRGHGRGQGNAGTTAAAGGGGGVWGGGGGYRRQPSGMSSRTSSWSFDSEEKQAMNAAEAAGLVPEPGTGPAQENYTSAAAARAAARREKQARRLHRSSHSPPPTTQLPNPQQQDLEHSMQEDTLDRPHDSQPGMTALGQGVAGASAAGHGASSAQHTGGTAAWAGAGRGPGVSLPPGVRAGLGGAVGAAARPVGRTGLNNARIHPDNKYYDQEPDFLKLSAQYPDLKKYMTLPSTPGGRCIYDYTSWEATRQLTATLLAADFGVQWWLPEGQLVPTLTNRLNYLHWLNDLLALSSPPGQQEVRGLDIGCGANYIYCLLGAALFEWHMVGVDITEVAITWANHNRKQNPQLQQLLSVRDARQHAGSVRGGKMDGGGMAEEGGLGDAQGVKDTAPGVQGSGEQEAEEAAGGVLMPAFESEEETFTFSMCNPPFFNSMAEANSNPNTACGGTAEEMVYPGGELAFIMKMVDDSVRLGHRVHWYTTMVGKKSTLKALRKELHTRHVTAIRTTEFAQGKTSRWAIAWSFEVDRSLANIPLKRPANPQLSAPTVAKKTVSFPLKVAKMDARAVLQMLNTLLSTQGATCNVDPALWRITAVLPVVEASGKHPSVGAVGATPQSTGAGGAEGAAGSVPSTGANTTPLSQGAVEAGAGSQGLAGDTRPGSGLAPRTAADLADVAEVALFAELSRRGEGPASGSSMMVQATKKARGAPEAVSSAALAAAAAVAHTLSLRINIFQQQRGQLEVTASIANNSSDQEAERFTQLINKVQTDLQAMCS